MSRKKSKKKNKTVNVNTRSAKKAAVLGTEKKSRTPLIIACVCAILAAGGAYAFYSISDTNTIATPASSGMSANASVVTYPVSLFSDGQARHFDYKHNDITIRYFVLKSSDGVIRAAFDACDVCWPSGKGYYQEDDYMVCRNCGRRFKSVLVNDVKGGCNPAPLKRGITGEKLVIEVSDIIDGRQYFNFSGKA